MAEVIIGEKELLRALGALQGANRKAAAAAMKSCAERCKALAVRYAPRSPTMANASAALKRKRRTASRKMPGALEKSISCESDATRASVYVARNALCVSSKGFNYAKRIHDERGKTWRNLGPGSVAKGGGVGEKFVERAVRDSLPWCRAAIEGRLRAAVGDAWRR